MPISLENVGIAVRDLEATISFFTDLGLTVLGRDEVSGEWAATAVGLDGNHAKIAVLQTPDGRGQIELFEYIHPDANETNPTLPNEIGMHRIAFSVDDIDESLAIAARHGFHPLRGPRPLRDQNRTGNPRRRRVFDPATRRSRQAATIPRQITSIAARIRSTTAGSLTRSPRTTSW